MDFHSIPVGDIGFGGLVFLVIVSIFRGWLVPGRTVKLITDSKDAQIKLLTEANGLLDKVTDEQSSQITALIDAGRTSHVALTTIAEAADGRR